MSKAAPHKTERTEPHSMRTAPFDAAATPWGDEAGAHEGDTPWLMSYLDFMTVLVALFVFLYAFEKARVTAEPAQAGPETAAVSAPAEAVAEPAATTTAVTEPAATEPVPAEQVPAEPPAAAVLSVTTAPPAVEIPAQTAAPATGQAVATPPPSAPEPAAANLPAEPTATVAEAAPTPAGEPLPAPPEAIPAKRDPLADLAPLADRIVVRQDAQKLLIEINDAVLFDPAKAELKGNGKALLDELLPTLRRHDGPITVEGHSDDRPIATARYPSNWELSAARASVVTRQLIGLGLASDRIRPVGHADTQPRASNATPEGRAQNRRVVIVLHKEPAG